MFGLIIVLGIICMFVCPAMGCALVGANFGGMALGSGVAVLMILGLCYLYELWEKKQEERGK